MGIRFSRLNELKKNFEKANVLKEYDKHNLLKDVKEIQTVDLVFIDGLHEYNQVKKDILNSLKFLNPNGIILVHDCLPSSMSKQAVPRYRMSWNGNVWKAIVDLRCERNIEIFTCEIDQGIAIIQNKNNTDLLSINKKPIELKFYDFYNNYKKYMRVISLEDFKKIFN